MEAEKNQQEWAREFKKSKEYREILNKLRTVENLLQSLEDFIKESGLNPPEKNVPLSDHEKIHFPKGYIRRKEDFIKNYRLWELIDDKNLRNNIAYALQATDIFNYFLNRFKIKLSAGTIFRKMSIVLTFSIAEAIVVGSYRALRKYCKNCPYSNKCEFYLLSPNNKKIKTKGLPLLLEILEDKKIIEPDIKDLMLKLKKVRDKVHIYTAKFNEYLKEEEYSLDTYNDSIKLLRYFKFIYPLNVRRFKWKRKRFCENIHGGFNEQKEEPIQKRSSV